MHENEEEATAVYAKKVHKGASDEVNRVISKQRLVTANLAGIIKNRDIEAPHCKIGQNVCGY
jgi:hypothetical protein